jgi:hypothetical protein
LLLVKNRLHPRGDRFSKMNNGTHKWLNSEYPQNYIVRSPFIGALLISLFYLGFSVLYKPLDTHASKSLTYESAMALYSLLSGLSVILAVRIIRSLKYFAKSEDWTILKEFLSVLLILSGIGIVVYVAGFFIEPPGGRWNLPTFLDSFKSAILIGIIPFAFFSAVNYSFLFPGKTKTDYGSADVKGQAGLPYEDPIKISSQLKKEELSFYPGEFLYAESDGNYVIFYLNRNNQVKKEVIRNSINNIEQQLSVIPYFLRTHRAYIVNLKMVRSRQGNTLGYRIKLTGTEFVIPVSRKNTGVFNKLFAQNHP